MKKYRIEIWQWHAKIAECTSDNPYEIVEWFDNKWKESYDNGMCAFYIYVNGKNLSAFDKISFVEQYRNKTLSSNYKVPTNIESVIAEDIDKIKNLVFRLTQERDEYKNKVEEMEKSLKGGTLSDGYHTFNDLYYQRCVLFATIVNQNKDRAWKSYRHEDRELCFGGGWFIVGVDTPDGSYTYHYENKYWDMFKCVELEFGKHWDGHTDKDVTRLLSL